MPSTRSPRRNPLLIPRRISNVQEPSVQFDRDGFTARFDDEISDLERYSRQREVDQHIRDVLVNGTITYTSPSNITATEIALSHEIAAHNMRSILDRAPMSRIREAFQNTNNFYDFMRWMHENNPELRSEIERLYPDILAHNETMPLTISDIQNAIQGPPVLTIGSDPELVLHSAIDQSPIAAFRYINDENHQSLFGYDGHSETAELRPQAESDPLKHAENIRAILNKSRSNAKFMNVYAMLFYPSSRTDSIGGHIHFGHPLFIRNGRQDATYQHDIQNLLYALDSLVAFPLMFLEIPEHAKKRKSSGDGSYGKLSGWRADKTYGFEYRTPPSWLATEELTKGTLALSYAIAHDFINNKLKMKNIVSNIDGFKQMYYGHNTELLFPMLSKAVRPEIKKLTLYPKYKDSIDYVLFHASRQNHLMSTEIKDGWRIPFVVVRELAVLTIREFIERMSKSIVVPKNINRTTERQFILYKSQDFQIPEIAKNINVCLNDILPKWSLTNSENYNVHIYGVKREAGSKFKINLNPSRLQDMEDMKIKRLQKLLTHVVHSFGDKETIIEVNASLTDSEEVPMHVPEGYTSQQMLDSMYGPGPTTNFTNAYNIPRMMRPRNYVARIGIPREVRERKNYMAEAVVLIVLLYANKSLYQSYKYNRESGERVSMPLMPQLLLKEIKSMVPFSKDLPEDIEEEYPWESERGE